MAKTITLMKWLSQKPAYIQDELWKVIINSKNRDDVWRKTQKVWCIKVDNLLQKSYKSFPKRLPEVLIKYRKK